MERKEAKAGVASVRALGFAFAIMLASLCAPAIASADHGSCGQPQSFGKHPSSSDALVVLRDAVGSGTCGDEQGDCECDVDDSGKVTPSDSLTVLRTAVGFPATLHCGDQCSGTTTTGPGETTTTLQGGATTTTEGDQGDDGQGDDNGGDQGGDQQGND
ncbi:MAG TPA: hypothetical protein VGK20_10450 [Candidatus Binatia bacterium]